MSLVWEWDRQQNKQRPKTASEAKIKKRARGHDIGRIRNASWEHFGGRIRLESHCTCWFCSKRDRHKGLRISLSKSESTTPCEVARYSIILHVATETHCKRGTMKPYGRLL